MKKIPTVFVRIYEGHKIIGASNSFTSELAEKAFREGAATIKHDGSCCAIIDGELYKRYDAKQGKAAPAGAIPCCEADPVTGHHPHWVRIDENNPADKWFVEAFRNGPLTHDRALEDGTYEAVGPHFQGNPYGLIKDWLVRHGSMEVDVERNFVGVNEFLEENYIEGLVFWLNGKPVAKIKRSDFGYEWNNQTKKARIK